MEVGKEIVELQFLKNLYKISHNDYLKNFIYLFIFGCAGPSLLHGFFSSCDEWGLLSFCRAWALGHAGFSSCTKAQ